MSCPCCPQPGMERMIKPTKIHSVDSLVSSGSEKSLGTVPSSRGSSWASVPTTAQASGHCGMMNTVAYTHAPYATNVVKQPQMQHHQPPQPSCCCHFAPPPQCGYVQTPMNAPVCHNYGQPPAPFPVPYPRASPEAFAPRMPCPTQPCQSPVQAPPVPNASQVETEAQAAAPEAKTAIDFSSVFLAYMSQRNAAANNEGPLGEAKDGQSGGRRGRRNRRRHPPQPVVQKPPKSEDPKAIVDPRKYKTRMCSNWENNGFCPYEHTCCFAHGPQELRDLASNHKLLASIGYFSNVILLSMSNGERPALPPHALYEQPPLFQPPQTVDELKAFTDMLPQDVRFPFQDILPGAVKQLQHPHPTYTPGMHVPRVEPATPEYSGV